MGTFPVWRFEQQWPLCTHPCILVPGPHLVEVLGRIKCYGLIVQCMSLGLGHWGFKILYSSQLSLYTSKQHLCKYILKEGSRFYPKRSAECGTRAHMVPALISLTGLKGLWNVYLVKEICWMAGESLQGNLKRALWEAVKVKPALCWRLKDVGNTSAIKHLPRKTS